MRSLTLKRRGDGVAVLLIDTPKRPVNVLSMEMLEEALALAHTYGLLPYSLATSVEDDEETGEEDA